MVVVLTMLRVEDNYIYIYPDGHFHGCSGNINLQVYHII